MVKDLSDSERGNPLPPHGLLIPISSKGSFIFIIQQTVLLTHTMTFVTPVVEQLYIWHPVYIIKKLFFVTFLHLQF